MKYPLQFFCVAALLTLSACASKPIHNPFYDATLLDSKHAVIKALNGDEKKNKPNMWNPFNKANWNTALLGIMKNLDADEWIRTPSSSLRVVPDSYIVKVQCSGKGFNVWEAVPLEDLKAGHDYLLECHGFSAHTVRVRVYTERSESPQAESPRPQS